MAETGEGERKGCKKFTKCSYLRSARSAGETGCFRRFLRPAGRPPPRSERPERRKKSRVCGLHALEIYDIIILLMHIKSAECLQESIKWLKNGKPKGP